MATQIFLGGAPAIAQVTTLTLSGTIAIGNTFSVTINGKTLTVAATDTTVATTVGLVAAAWEALSSTSYPEFAEIGATATSSTVVLVANTPGFPFTIASVAHTGSASWTQSATTTSSGPNDWSVAGNWSTGSVPASGDDVFIQNISTSIYFGLSQSAVSLNSLNILPSFTGQIGLTQINTDAAPYAEYRPQYLAISPGSLNIGQGGQTLGSGSNMIKVDYGSSSPTINVYSTGQQASQALESVLIRGSGSSTVNYYQGTVALAGLPGDSCTVGTLNLGYTNNTVGDGTVRIGAGGTVTTVDQTGSALVNYGSLTTYVITNGTGTIYASGITTLSMNGGSVSYQSSGTIGTLTIASGASIDFSKNNSARTITNCTIYTRGSLSDPYKTCTFTNPIELPRASLPTVTLDLGENITIARTSLGA